MQEWLFWAAAAALTAGVAVTMLQGLRRGDATADNSAALKVYRDQLAEVDRDLARAVIAPAEADRLKTEISRRLLEADRSLQNAPQAGGKGSMLPAALLIAAASSAALYGYLRLGAPGYGDLPLQSRIAMAEQLYANRPSQTEAEAAAPAPDTAAATQADPAFLDLMTKLRAAVAQNPGDQQGLTLLARNEAQLGNFIAARKAYEQLLALKGDTATADDHAATAQSMIFAAGGKVTAEAEKHLIRALELEPTHPLARYFVGLMFAEVDRPDRAFALWEPLLREGPADAPWMAPLTEMLPAVAANAGIKFQMPGAGKGPTAMDMAAAGDMTPEERQDMIEGMVSQLEDRLGSEGGPVEEWAKLINSLTVLGDADRVKAAYAKAQAAFKDDSAALATLQDAASAAGVAP